MLTYDQWLGTGVVAGRYELRFDCPKCGNPKRKFYWNKQLGVGHCFHCGYKARLVQLVRDVPLDYKASTVDLSRLKQLERIKVPPGSRRAIVEGNAEIPGVPVELSPLSVAYLLNRSVDPSEIDKYEIQVMPSFPRRIVLPVRSVDGKMVGWTARATNDVVRPKYKTAAGFSIKNHLYGAYFARPRDEIVLVEGPFDQIRYGDGSVATFGKSLSDAQLQVLLSLEPTVVSVMWDADARYEALTTTELLSTRFRVKLVELPHGDPGSWKREELRQLVASTLYYRSSGWLLKRLKEYSS